MLKLRKLQYKSEHLKDIKGTLNDNKLVLKFLEDSTAACRAVAVQLPRDGRIYQGRYWATTR
jgi:hypothetical protein